MPGLNGKRPLNWDAEQRSAGTSHAPMTVPFREALAEGGYVEQKNVAMNIGWRTIGLIGLPHLASDPASPTVTVIAAIGSAVGVRAAKREHHTIPIVLPRRWTRSRQGLLLV